MTLFPPPAPGAPRLTERLRRRDRLLGALTPPGHSAIDLLTGLDAVVLIGPTTYGQIQALRELRKPVLVRVSAVDGVGPAIEAGADGVVADAATAEEAATVVARTRQGFGAGARGSPAGSDPMERVVVVVGPAELASVDGVSAVLSDHGRARIVTSPEAARKAFATGADLVLYDLQAMHEALLAITPDGPLAVREQTDREPLVLLSGMLGDASLWDAVAARLGEAVQPWPARIDLDDSIREMAASVLAEAPPQFGLAGHSLGGIVALEIMRQAPQRITRLILISASARSPTEAQLDAWARWRRRTVHGEFDDVVAEISRATLPAPSRDDQVLLDAIVRMAHTIGPEGFLRQLTAQSTRPDSRDSLSAIEIPVLVMSGELDEVCPPPLQLELAEHCRHADFVTAEGAGHMLPLEYANLVADHLCTQLARR